MSALLEREYNELRSRRVNLRRRIEKIDVTASFNTNDWYGPDGLINTRAQLAAELRGTERRWQELGLLLRKPSGPPVKLDAPVRRAR